MIKFIKELFNRIHYWKTVDRIGPDIITQHWKLYFKSLMLKYCKAKFLEFAEDAEVRPGAYIFSPSHVSIGHRVVIRPEVVLSADDHARICIEDNVMLGMGVHVYVNNHKFSDPNQPIIDQGYFPSADVIIKNGAWIGANAIILPGVVIGRNAVIGAGSIVTKSIPDKVVAVGNPATIKRRL